LYKLTPMQESFGIILLAIVDGRPKLLTLRDTLTLFLTHRREVVRRRTAFDLKKAQDRLHLLDGLRIALNNLDAVLQVIRQGQNPTSVRQTLMAQFSLSEIQAQAILDMRLQRLTQLEQGKIIEEYNETVALINRLQEVLASAQEIDAIIKEELNDIKTRFADERRTQIISETTDFSDEDLIVEEDMVVTVSHEGYIKRNQVTLYRSQRRGGRGVVGATTREEDFVEHLFISSTHSFLMVFTTIGRVYWVKVHEIPQGSRTARGKALVNLLPLREGERISAFLPVREFKEDNFLVFATRKGLVKKTELMAYANPRRDGIIALALEEDDEVIGVRLTDGQQEVLLSTKSGQAIRFSEEEVRPTGRGTYGVKGITIDEKDAVVSLETINKEATLLTVSARGYGKRSHVDDYRIQSRGGKGVITMRTTDKTGEVVSMRQVKDDDHLMLVTDTGRIIRLRMAELRVIGRNTQGVRLLNTGPEERVVSLALLAEKEDEVAAEEVVVSVEEDITSTEEDL